MWKSLDVPKGNQDFMINSLSSNLFIGRFFVFSLTAYYYLTGACLSAWSLAVSDSVIPWTVAGQSSVNGILQTRILGALLLASYSMIFPIQVSNSYLSNVPLKTDFYSQYLSHLKLIHTELMKTSLMLEHPASPNTPNHFFYFLSLEAQLSDSYFYIICTSGKIHKYETHLRIL